VAHTITDHVRHVRSPSQRAAWLDGAYPTYSAAIIKVTCYAPLPTTPTACSTCSLSQPEGCVAGWAQRCCCCYLRQQHRRCWQLMLLQLLVQGHRVLLSWWGLRVCWHGGGWQGGRGGRHWGGRALLTVGKMSEGWGRLGQMAV